MNRRDWFEALKWGLAITLAALLWTQIAALRAARSEERGPAPDYQPRWAILLFISGTTTEPGVREFLFPTYHACTEAARFARKTLGLHITPACRLRWVDEGASKAGR